VNTLARIFAICILGLVGFGLVRVASDPARLQFDMPSFSLPEIDDRPRVRVNPGMRLTFDEPTSWNLASHSTTEVRWCNGTTEVIVGPAHVENVCALTPYD
jgi:hypothetical protein